jgi:hypothetical protein
LISSSRELETDDDENHFDETLGTIARQKPKPKEKPSK